MEHKKMESDSSHPSGDDSVARFGSEVPKHDLSALMVEHRISVWLDPNWWEGNGLPRWLAGKNVKAVEGIYYSTLTGSDPATIEADYTCMADTPLQAVMAVIASAPKEAA